jgi:hypothetical protein
MTVETFKISDLKVELTAPVKQRIDLSDLVILRIYPSDQELGTYPQDLLNRNIYAFDLLGNLKWQIKEAPHGGAGMDKAYMDIRLESGVLIAGNWIGVDYFVDLGSGDVSQTTNNLRPW